MWKLELHVSQTEITSLEFLVSSVKTVVLAQMLFQNQIIREESRLIQMQIKGLVDSPPLL